MQLLAELAGPIGLGGGQVVGLAQIVGQVVELDVIVFEELDQLPIAVAHGSAGNAPLVSVVRIVPIERPLRPACRFA